ncbi:hypothetical protein B6I21_07925 [candidate division KSB1 bacterium 4572_119]|nr:MAG: hypothetical protein B6I21_07925 [candidate division KSB1 bacterium 4572_119]
MRKLFLIYITFILSNSTLFAGQNVEFKLVTSEATKSVHVAGDFNNWSKTSHPLFKSSSGLWKTSIELEPGEYEYRFLVNGSMWIKDPKNPHWRGEHSNSILWVKSPQSPEILNLKPETGSILKTADVRISATYRSGLGQSELDSKNTAVLLNGQKIPFTFNQKLNRVEIFPGKLKDGEYLLEINARDKQNNKARKVESYFIVNAINMPPVADAGYTIVAGINSTVHLNSGVCYDPDNEPIAQYNWKLIDKPQSSQSSLKNKNLPFPNFVPDKVGRYLFTLQISDGTLKSKPDTVDVYAFVKREYPVKFELSDSLFFSIYETSIESVSVAGEFNRWSATDNPLFDYDRDGNWAAWLNLDPGEYEYKFVVNGQHWIPDPANPRKAADGWEGFNSIKTSSLNLAPIIDVKAVFGPGKIVFDATSSHSQMGEKIDFLWFQDINNPQRFDLKQTGKFSIPTPHNNGTYYFYLVEKDKYGNSSNATLSLNVDKGKVKIQNFSRTPQWSRDAIVYEIFPRKFSKGGDLKGIIDKIPYLKTLGINCIWLMPINESPTSHGYGPSDFFRIETDYGSMEDFQKLIGVAREAGIKVLLDFIANHSSDQHPYFRSAFNNPFSAFRDWYHWKKPDQNKNEFYCYEFHNDWDTLPNLNYENPNVRHYILKAAKFWANLGADGFRCDVAWGVPHDFWKIFRRELKNINPDFLLIDEVLPRSPEFHKDEFDMSYDTDFFGNVLDVLENRKPLSAIFLGLEKTKKNYPAETQDFRYMENHDMERFIKQFGKRKTKLAAALLLTIPGTPLIYYGQETGLLKKTANMKWDVQGNNLFDFYKKLILLRRHQPALKRGEMIKISSNFENQVFAYTRKDKNDSFLVILNFGEKIENCRLQLSNSFFNKKISNKLNKIDVLTNIKTSSKISKDFQIKVNLDAETPYIFRIIQ